LKKQRANVYLNTRIISSSEFFFAGKKTYLAENSTITLKSSILFFLDQNLDLLDHQ
jgi:hypothetical protein